MNNFDQNTSKNRIEMHHLLECIIWPNVDGSFRLIMNKAEDLERLGVYEKNVMVIPIPKGIHSMMHRKFEEAYGYVKDAFTFSGRKHSEESKKKMSAAKKGKRTWNYMKRTSTNPKVLRKWKRQEARLCDG